jgi:mevalonate kinase
MMYHTETYGKWILCGEQAVIRGYPAIVFPLGNYSLKLKYTHDSSPIKIVSNQAAYTDALSSTWKQCWAMFGKSHASYAQEGYLAIESNIPIGQGMGASAALCLAVARCVHYLLSTPEPDIWKTAKQLEDHFHGESSGLDILGSGSRQGEWFHQGKHRSLKLKWHPCCTLTPSHEIGSTANAIAKVKKLNQENPNFGLSLDKKMEMSVNMALEALEQQHHGLERLAQAIKLSNTCFEDWGLITPNMQEKIGLLYAKGALAVKPTGSGGGGYLLSLWSPEIYTSLKAHDSDLKITLPGDNTSHQP